DTAAERLLRQEGIEPRIYDGVVEPYRDLALGRLDAVFLDLPIALYYARPNRDLAFAGAPIGRGYYAIALRKRDADLPARIDAGLERLFRDGTVRRIYEKWNLWNDDQEQLLAASADDILTESRQKWTFSRYFPLLLRGAWVTIELSFVSMGLA